MMVTFIKNGQLRLFHFMIAIVTMCHFPCHGVIATLPSEFVHGNISNMSFIVSFDCIHK